jgi:hypothetical protein
MAQRTKHFTIGELKRNKPELVQNISSLFQLNETQRVENHNLWTWVFGDTFLHV